MKKVILPQLGFVASNLRLLALGFVTLVSAYSFSSEAYAEQVASGEQKTLVVLVNFQENPQEIPISKEDAHHVVFNTVSDFYSQMSQGQLWLSGDVAGTFTLPISNQICDDDAVAAEANKMAETAGYQLSNYDRFIYLTTKTGCASEGSGSQGVTPSRASINAVFEPRVIAHELGHNFGLHHASALDCKDGTLAGDCRVIEYGDSYDTMGNYDMGYFSAFQLENLGWQTSPAQIISSDGVYSIDAYEDFESTSSKVLKIPRGTDPITGQRQWFYVEYRQALGYDSFLRDRSYIVYRQDVTEGVVVRLATDGDLKSSRLLHMKPDSTFKQLFGSNDWEDPALPIGGTFTEPKTGVSITLESANGQNAQVSVIFGGESGQCVATSPLLSLTPLSGSDANAGETLAYNLKVTNQNNTECADATYTTALSVPDGWNYDASALTVPSGMSAETTVMVTSNSDAQPNSYSITVDVIDAENEQSAKTELSYTVLSESTSPLEAVNDSVTISDKSVVRIEQLNNDSFEQSTSLAITVAKPNKGSARVLSDGSIEYTPSKKFKNNDSFTYTISDGQSSSTATISITLQSTSGGNGGGNGKGKPN